MVKGSCVLPHGDKNSTWQSEKLMCKHDKILRSLDKGKKERKEVSKKRS